ncbi:hypothetical protein NQ314_017239 [Rhamnusium bicolor]|uniref:Uncharacterized protein n=1 Tax=Rhamnusium bicolor TaxID=1586634 RepID=A0AAV8WUX4_9CUCU|nr:hypothetical protein NQ314_017239 [Rhamnusium bicolor]
MKHDIAYSHSKDINSRHRADKVLAEKAYQLFKASDSSIGEKNSALGVSGIMQVKTKLGMDMRKSSPNRLKLNFGWVSAENYVPDRSVVGG